MSFQQGLSGLSAAAKNLDVIGNNVSNSNTVGFKRAEAQFSDVYANSLNGGGAGSQVGIGTKVSAVLQQFSQGNITASENPLDVAINGAGFFRFSNNGTISYSRNGQFQLDNLGYIVNATGARLTGYTADVNGVLDTSAPQELKINTADLAPQATTKVDALLNLDSRQAAITAPFNLTDPTTFNHSTSVSVYDSLGNPHVMSSYYVKTAAGTWDVYAAVDGVQVGSAAVGTLHFTPAGAIDTSATTLPFSISVPVTTGATSPMTYGFDFAGTTQFGSNFGVNALSQDGFASGRLSGFNIGADGVILGRYTNGRSSKLGQVILANFANPQGLEPLGNNAFAESSHSGTPLIGPPNTGSLGVLQASAVEDSNVDLTAELVNMITAQRVYQANAQTIKAQDQVLQTLVNLR